MIRPINAEPLKGSSSFCTPPMNATGPTKARPKVIVTISKYPAGCPATTSKTSARVPATPPEALVVLIPQPELRLQWQLHLALREVRWANEFRELHRALCAPADSKGGSSHLENRSFLGLIPTWTSTTVPPTHRLFEMLACKGYSSAVFACHTTSGSAGYSGGKGKGGTRKIGAAKGKGRGTPTHTVTSFVPLGSADQVDKFLHYRWKRDLPPFSFRCYARVKPALPHTLRKQTSTITVTTPPLSH